MSSTHGFLGQGLQNGLIWMNSVFRRNRRRLPMAAFQTLLGLTINVPGPRVTALCRFHSGGD